MRIGFIGLGIMGAPMARNLLRGGHEMRVWARREGAARPLLDAGALAATSPAHLAQGSDLVISCVSDAPAVREVTLGEEGIRDGAAPGLLYMDMSTIAPTAAREIARQLAEPGVEMLDAPVSGGEVGAINATLTIMVGGAEQAYERVKPVLAQLGSTTTWVGPSGAGQVAKACNQILTGVGIAAVAEALNFARRSGVDPARVREAMLGGFAASRILEHHGQRMLDRAFEPGFKAWMHQKDLQIVMQEAHGLGVAVPNAAVTGQLFNALVGQGRGEQDSIALLKLMEQMSGGIADDA